MSQKTCNHVLVVDDQLSEILGLLDEIRRRGYKPVVVTNKMSAEKKLRAVGEKKSCYAAAIIDVMVAIADLLDLEGLDEQFFTDSRDSGIELCRLARQELHLSADELPIACLTVRDDDEVKAAMEELDIPRYHRIPQSSEESIFDFIQQYLPPRDSR